jgi:hypothetical protein
MVFFFPQFCGLESLAIFKKNIAVVFRTYSKRGEIPKKIVARKISPKKCLKLNEVMKGGLLKNLQLFVCGKFGQVFHQFICFRVGTEL